MYVLTRQSYNSLSSIDGHRPVTGCVGQSTFVDWGLRSWHYSDCTSLTVLLVWAWLELMKEDLVVTEMASLHHNERAVAKARRVYQRLQHQELDGHVSTARAPRFWNHLDHSNKDRAQNLTKKIERAENLGTWWHRCLSRMEALRTLRYIDLQRQGASWIPDIC